MKKLIHTVLLLGILFSSFGQNQSTQVLSNGASISATGNNMNFASRVDMFATTRAIDVSKFNNIDGSPFLSNDYKKAFIKTKNGEKFNNVWIKFNTYNNEILLDNGSHLIALSNLDSISYQDEKTEGEKTNIILKTGYPSLGDRNTESIYQVLASTASLQFLKYYETKIETVKKMGMPDRKEFITNPKYYLYHLGTRELKLVKLNKSLLNELGDYDAAKTKASELSTNFKSEKDVISLLSSL